MRFPEEFDPTALHTSFLNHVPDTDISKALIHTSL
jgi:hypothetical protein